VLGSTQESRSVVPHRERFALRFSFESLRLTSSIRLRNRWRNAMLDLGDAPSGVETNHTIDCGEMAAALVSMDVEVSAKMNPTIFRTRYFSLAGQRGAEEVEPEGLVRNQRHPTRTRRACLRNARRPPIFISQSRCTTRAPRSKSSAPRPRSVAPRALA
jgi:hypothetical protein